jgi:hypothetical protein
LQTAAINACRCRDFDGRNVAFAECVVLLSKETLSSFLKVVSDEPTVQDGTRRLINAVIT